MIRRSLFAISTLALFANLLSAAGKPDFSGSWKMDAAKSEFGPVPGPEKLSRTIVHKDPEMSVKSTQSGPQGEVTSEMKYKTDGSPSVNKMRNAEVTSTVAWAGDKLTVKYKREMQGGEISFAETWALSADGKVLTVTNAIEAPQGSFEMKYHFDKQ